MKKWPFIIAATGTWLFLPHLRARYATTHIIRQTTDAGILLTFDDGVHPLYTPRLLRLLEQYEIRTIFFVIGERAARHPDIVKMIHEQGHVLGIHHYTHTSTFFLTKRALHAQIVTTKALLEDITV